MQSCPMCGASLQLRWSDVPVDVPGSATSRDIWACHECRSLWTDPADVAAAPVYYDAKPATDHVTLEAGGVSRFRKVGTAVERALGTGSYSALDVGAANGAYLSMLGPDVQKFAVEPSQSAQPLLESRDIEWVASTVDKLPDGCAFDAVTCLDVIEHVADPLEFLRQMDRVLAPGGVMAIVTGNIESPTARIAGRRWVYYALPEHRSFFSWRSLRGPLGDMGYRLVERRWIENEDIRPRYVLRFLKGLAIHLVAIVRPSIGANRSFPFFCDNMLIVVRKPRQVLAGVKGRTTPRS